MLVAIALTLAMPAQKCRIVAHILPSDDTRPADLAGEGLWIGGIAFKHADIAGATVREDKYSQSWVIDISFTAAGNAKFMRSQYCGVGRPIEFSMDRVVLSRPRLNEPILGGKASITGNWSDRDAAEKLAARIRGS